MEHTRFDGLAKEVSRSRSRRQVLRGLAMGSGIGALALLGVKSQEAAARVVCDGGTRHCGRNEAPPSRGLAVLPLSREAWAS